MHPKVERFLREARNKELQEREKILIELGLYEDIEVNGNDGYDYHEYDPKSISNKYYKRNIVDISDEEYEIILKHSHSNKQNLNYKNGAEQFLGVINTIILIIGIIAAIVLVFTGLIEEEIGYALYGICVVLITTIYWAVIKVTLNISNNLHQINAKLK
jgi:hypothetical protein